jgi:hypothetical protein
MRQQGAQHVAKRGVTWGYKGGNMSLRAQHE